MKVIYQPKGQAREYAPLACNLYRGCGHHCAYCYAPSATFRSREEFGQPKPRKNIIPLLEKDARRRQDAGQTGQVLLCFTCDPYQPIDTQHKLTRAAIEILHRYGHTVQILTKGGTMALRDIDLLGPGDAFATTMTLLDPARSKEWEPHAAGPADRTTALKAMCQAGIPTWVSLEPVIDPEVTLDIIRSTQAFVDQYKVGKLNYAGALPPTLRQQVISIDWHDFAADVIELLEQVKVPYYIKESLRPFVPPGTIIRNPDDYQLGTAGQQPTPQLVQGSLF